MKTLGHSQISLTMSTYAHVLPEIERAAVDDAARHLSDDQKANGCIPPNEKAQPLPPARSELGLYRCAARDSNPEPAD
jgi:hypothetical protein